MSSASQLPLQKEIDTVQADIQQAKQDLYAAEEARDESVLAFRQERLQHLQRQLEQLHALALALLQAQAAGQLGLVLSLVIFLHRLNWTLLPAQLG